MLLVCTVPSRRDYCCGAGGANPHGAVFETDADAGLAEEFRRLGFRLHHVLDVLHLVCRGMPNRTNICIDFAIKSIHLLHYRGR